MSSTTTAATATATAAAAAAAAVVAMFSGRAVIVGGSVVSSVSPGGVNSIASNNDSMVIANSPIIGGKSSISSFQESFVLVDHPGHNINNSAATAAAAHGGSWRLYNVDGQQQRPAGVRASTQLSHNSVNSEHDNNAGSGRRRFQRSATTKPLPALPSSLSSSALDQHQYSSNSYSGSGSGGGGGTSPRMATSKAYVNGNGTVPAATSAIAQSRPLSALKFSRLMAALPDFHTNNSGGGSKSRGELNTNIRPASTSRVPAAGGASPIFNSLDDQIADLIRSPINATHDVSGLPRNYSSGSLLHTQSGVNGGHAATLSASHQLDTESMSKMPLRYHVISEMVDTEAKFAENMSLVYTEWLEPVMNSIQAANEKPIMDLDDARIIFGEIENLRDHSMAMYWDLQMMLDLTLWNSIHNIDEQQQSQLDAVDSSVDLDGQQPPQHDGARVGCIFFDPKRDWDIFTRYVLGYNSALQAVERAERGKQFQRHEKEVLDSRRTNRHLLRDLLMQPIQRIMRYSLLLRALLKNTSEEHADYDDLQTAMAQMTSLTEHLNNLRKMQEDMAERDLIANSIMNCPQLVRRMSRRLVSDAYLMQLIGTKRQRVRVLVFSDVLVVAHSFNTLVNRAAWTMSLSLNRTNSGNTSAGGSSSMVLLSPASTLTAAALASSPVSSATMSNGNNNGNGEKQRWKHVYTFDLRLISILPFAAKDNKFSITVSGSEDYSALEHSTNWPATSLSAISLASAPPPSTLPNSSSITKLIQPLSHHQSQSQPLPSFTSMASSTKTSSGGPSRSDSTGSAHTSGSNRSTQIVWMSPTANISTNNSSTSPPPPAALPLPQAPPPSAPLAPTSVHIPRRSSSTMSGSKSMSSTMLPLLPPLDTSSAALAPTDADGGAPTSPMSIVPIVHYGGNSREYSHGEPDSLSSSANGAGGATATVAGVLANGSKTIDLHFQCADESARNDLVAQIRTAIYEARL
ncbi:hypothetical protein GQ42DRAFT_181498 [Ramicandelaber brevisporus]|nr:hypothetical protein GQ42DRAFT_181498 [Ramicandelaber brevisporus]